MALTRGANGLAPCPICVVPSNELSDLSKCYKLRDTKTHKNNIDPESYQSLTEREEKLKKIGLRPVEVSFSLLAVYAAKSLRRMCSGKLQIRTPMMHFLLIDCMHIMGGSSGIIFGVNLKRKPTLSGEQLCPKLAHSLPFSSNCVILTHYPILSRFDMMPRWRGLYHCNKVMLVSFSDGSKLEDISKVNFIDSLTHLI